MSDLPAVQCPIEHITGPKSCTIRYHDTTSGIYTANATPASRRSAPVPSVIAISTSTSTHAAPHVSLPRSLISSRPCLSHLYQCPRNLSAARLVHPPIPAELYRLLFRTQPTSTTTRGHASRPASSATAGSSRRGDRMRCLGCREAWGIMR